MIFRSLIAIVIFRVIIACSPKTAGTIQYNQLVFTQADNYIFDVPESNNSISLEQVYYHEKDSFIVLHDRAKKINEILIYNIPSFTLRQKIKIDNILKNSVETKNQIPIQILFTHPDTFVILYSSLHVKKQYHDSTIIKIDTALKACHHFTNYSGSLLFSRSDTTQRKQNASYIVNQSANRPLQYDGKNLYFTCKYAKRTASDSLFGVLKPPFSGHFDFTSPEKPVVMHKIAFPENYYKFPYYDDYDEVYNTLNEKGNLVYGFGGSNWYIEYNPNTGDTKKYWVPSAFNDTILPYNQTNIKKITEYDPYRYRLPHNLGYYGALFYDKWNKRYVRLIETWPAPNAHIADLNRKQYAIMLLDTNFKILGIGKIPPEVQKGGYPRLLVLPQGYYFLNWDQSRLTKHTIYNGYRVTISNHITNQKIYTTSDSAFLHTTGWESYLKDIHNIIIPKTDKFMVVVVPVLQSCPSCVPSTVQLTLSFRENNPELRNKIRLILVAPQDSMVQQIRRNPRFTGVDSVLYVDSLSKKKLYVLDEYNPTVLFFEKGKITKNANIGPTQIPILNQMYTYLFEGKEVD